MKYTLLKNRITGQRLVKNNETGLKVYEAENPIEYSRLRKLAISNRNKAEKYQCMKDLGLVSYKNASGTTCWE